MQPVRSSARVEILSAAVEPAVADFLAEASVRGLSIRTRDEYGRLIRRFLSIRSFASADVHSFVFSAGPSGRLPTPATAAVRRAALVAFFAFLRRRSFLEVDPTSELPRIRLQPSMPRGLSMDDVRRLLAAIPETPSGVRDRAIVTTALYTGLRRSELMSLTHADVDLSATPRVVVQMKGGRRMQRDLPPPAAEAIRSALAIRHRGEPLDSRLFAVSSAGFAANLRRYGAQVGIAALSPHVLRHTAAKLRRKAGASLEEVSDFLGHASIATTAIYLRRLEGWHDQRWAAVSQLLSRPTEGEPGMEARAGPANEVAERAR